MQMDTIFRILKVRKKYLKPKKIFHISKVGTLFIKVIYIYIYYFCSSSRIKHMFIIIIIQIASIDLLNIFETILNELACIFTHRIQIMPQMLNLSELQVVTRCR